MNTLDKCHLIIWVCKYPTRTDLVPEDAKGRIEFVGKVAHEAIRQKYLLGDVTAYTKVSQQAPCLYIK